MNILIPHSWLSDYLKTSAKPYDIAKSLSLCGPSIDRLEKKDDDFIYDVEVTTNRVDTMSIQGFAREAAAILPRFGYKAVLKGQAFEKTEALNLGKKLDIKIINNPKLCKRVLAIKLNNVQLGQSSSWMAERLVKVGQRPLNNAIDITNYVMWEIGHPLHVFDYDRIIGKKILVREAKKGESLITLDAKKYTLSGGEVIFDDGRGEIIDLPGIMGTKNTVVTPDTKNVLLWIESVDPVKIRQASMNLNIRSQAAVLNEKGVDPELGFSAIKKAVALFKKLTKAEIGSSLTDIYPSPYIPKEIKTAKSFIYDLLGIEIPKAQIKTFLSGLGFSADWKGDSLVSKVPSFRASDINIPEDIVEEIARIYGYHKLPSELKIGSAPNLNASEENNTFRFENKIKNTLKGWGAIEVYTSSLVSKEFVGKAAYKLINPLGTDGQYLRTSLVPSLIEAARKNSGEKEPFHIFEVANVYLPRRNKVKEANSQPPDEKMTLAGIFSNYSYRESKGIVESLLEELNIEATYHEEDSAGFLPNQRLVIKNKGQILGQFGVLSAKSGPISEADSENYVYYEFDTKKLASASSPFPTFKPIPKYPAQIEDITLVLPTRTRVGEVVKTIFSSSKYLSDVQLSDIYKENYTFRIWYQRPDKTLTDEEVQDIRDIIIKEIKKKFGASLV